MVAIVRRYDPREVERATPPREVRAPQTAVGELGAALGDLGEAAWTFEDEIATAHAYQTDTEWTQFLTNAMSGDGTEGSGYLNQRGLDATGNLAQLVESVQTRYREMVQSLNPRVRPQTVRSMETRYQTFLRQANRHAEAQAAAGRSAAGAARVNASRDAAIRAGIMGDTEAFRENLAAIEATAAELYPNDPEAATAYIREQGSDAHRAVVQGIAAENGASAAWEYVEGNPDVFDTGDLWTMRDDYYEGAMTERGAAVADAAVAEAIAASIERPQAAAETLEAANDATRLTASRFTDQPLSFSPPEAQGEGLVSIADANPDMMDPRQEGVAGGPDRSNLQPLINETVAARAPAPAPALPSVSSGFDLSFSLPAPNVIEPPTYVPPDFSSARETIMQIENPLARQAALQRLDDQIEAYEEQMTRVHDEALTQAQQIILDNQGAVGTVDRIPPEIMRHLTPTEREGLRTFERSTRQNRDPETPEDLLYSLELASQSRDAARLGALLAQPGNAAQMSRAHRIEYDARLAALVAGERQTIDDVEWGSVRTLVNRTMEGFGINPSDDPAMRMAVDNRVNRWIEGEIRRNERVPSQPEIMSFISSQLVEATINPPGAFNQRRGQAIEFDFGNLTPTPDDDVNFQMLAEAAGNEGLSIGDVDITLDQLIEARDVLMETLQRSPTMDELWGALARMAGVQ